MNIDRYIQEFSLWNFDNFWIIYDKYVKKIYDYFYYRILDSETSEDLTSDIFMKIFSKDNNFSWKTEQEFNSWIYRVAHNKLVDYYRTSKQDIWLEDLEYEPWYENKYSQNLDNKTKIEEVLTYLNTIDDEKKEILIMRIWDDLSYKEIAQITWKSVDNCKKIVSRLMLQIEANLVMLLIIFFKF